MISGEFWINEGIPYILSKFESYRKGNNHWDIKKFNVSDFQRAVITMKKKEFEARKVLDDTEIYNDFISKKEDKVESGKISKNKRNLHIIGMAKSSLNLIGGKLKNLELDYLRLIYASQNCESSDKVIAYLLVWDEKIKKVIEEKWNKKYKVEEGYS